MRNLASIQEIKSVEPIEGADRIEKARVLGWNVVVKKGEFKAGDKCVYVEIDSILPADNPDFAFLEGKRLRTKKLKGVVSQGICFPLSVLPDSAKKKIGTDVTDIIGAKKWEPDVNNRPDFNTQKNKKWYMRFRIGRWIYNKFFYKPTAKKFPTELALKTDETRVQILEDILEKYKGTKCFYTEKLDGSSITIWMDSDKTLHVCSRNREIFNKEDVFYATAMKYYDRIKMLPYGIVLQGELIGPNIQGNKYGLKEPEIRFYQAQENKIFYNELTFQKMTSFFAGLPIVPYLGTVILENDVDKFIELSKGKSALANVPREGIVIRPVNQIHEVDKRFVGGRLSFKAINPDFLLKYNL